MGAILRGNVGRLAGVVGSPWRLGGEDAGPGLVRLNWHER